MPAANIHDRHAAQIMVKSGQADFLVDVAGDIRVNLGVRVEIVPAEPDVGNQRGTPDAVPSEGHVVAGHIDGVVTRND